MSVRDVGQPVEQLLVRHGAVVRLVGVGILVVLHEADDGRKLAVGPESARRQVGAQALRPVVHKALSAAQMVNEGAVDPLDPPGSALVLEARHALVELPPGEPTAMVLPAEPLGLVVAEAALIHPGRA